MQQDCIPSFACDSKPSPICVVLVSLSLFPTVTGKYTRHQTDQGLLRRNPSASEARRRFQQVLSAAPLRGRIAPHPNMSWQLARLTIFCRTPSWSWDQAEFTHNRQTSSLFAWDAAKPSDEPPHRRSSHRRGKRKKNRNLEDLVHVSRHLQYRACSTGVTRWGGLTVSGMEL